VLGLRDGGQGAGGAGKDHEEAVALGVDFAPAVVRPRLAQEALVVGEHLGVAVAETLRQSGGAFDVGEQKGDGPRWQVRHGPPPHDSWERQ
jgi:hypothetical protein